jgi:hypothetical protein
MKIKVLYFFSILLFSSVAFGQSTYEFLKLDMSARAGALGGSFISNSDDPNVIFYNPAGMKLLTGSPASFSFFHHLLDINLASVVYSTDIEGIGRMGAAIKYVNYGKFPIADEFGFKSGEFGAGELELVTGYSGMLDNNFFYGANLKFIYSSIYDRSSTALAADLGLHYYIPSQEINIGFSILNLGSQLSAYYTTKEDLPLDISVGVSKKLQYLPLRLYLDFHRLNEQQDNFIDRLQAFTVGAEFNLSKVLRLRLGYDNERRKELKIGTYAGLAGFNVGFGAVISGYNFDYGYSSLGQIGAFHRISIGTTF